MLVHSDPLFLFERAVSIVVTPASSTVSVRMFPESYVWTFSGAKMLYAILVCVGKCI